MPITLAEIERNRRASNLKHLNWCRNSFIKENKEDIDTMKLNIACGLPIEILSGPCKGMVLKSNHDLHAYIEKHAEDMAKGY